MNANIQARRTDIDYAALAQRIKAWGAELGFAKIGITDVDVAGAGLRSGEQHAGVVGGSVAIHSDAVERLRHGSLQGFIHFRHC